MEPPYQQARDHPMPSTFCFDENPRPRLIRYVYLCITLHTANRKTEALVEN